MNEGIAGNHGNNAGNSATGRNAAQTKAYQDYQNQAATTACPPPQPVLIDGLLMEISSCIMDCLQSDSQIGNAIFRLIEPRPADHPAAIVGGQSQPSSIQGKLNALLNISQILRRQLVERANELNRAV